MSEPSAPLSALLPTAGGPPPSSDDVLDRFVRYATSAGLSLYPAQEEAILELYSGKHVVLGTPTGSGKSLVAFALLFKAMAEGTRGFYTCPIKALVNEKFFALCDAFGPERVGMLTGDAAFNRDAPLICCTAEILANLALREDRSDIGYVVMDEFHYYSDPERGVAWQLPLLAMPKTAFLLMSATLGDTTAIQEKLSAFTGRAVAEVKSGDRPVPLDFEYRETPLHETIQTLLEAGKAPVYLVNFTQRGAAEQAQALTSVNVLTKEQKETIRQSLFDARFDTPYGKDVEKYLRHGLGLHHAGLLPKYRLLTEKLAQTGLLKVVSGTDTLGVGVNVPIRTVLFTQLCKFDGQKTGILSVREFHQIAGRAGRKGFDDRGTVVVQAPEHAIENLRLEEKKQQGKKVVKKQPPQKGYVHWDRATFERLLSRPPEPLESRFAVTHGLLLTVLQSRTGMPIELDGRRAGGFGRLVDLLFRSHESDYKKRKLLVTATQAFRTLRSAGLISVERRARGGRAAEVVVDPALQNDFSLNHTLGLYLLETIGKLDRTLETYALDLLTLVESILENPTVILYAQLHELKGKKVAELKAQGMEYEDRMEELEKLEWPKPNRDFIYGTFDAFAAKHPWVGHENIRPKSVAREMVERFLSFNDYVKEYGLQRSEGLLLRYLSDTYKTLAQSVPEAAKSDEVLDLQTQLRIMVRQVDSSLLDEWEAMKRPGEARPARSLEPARLGRELDLSRDPRALASRVRGELHRLLKALSGRAHEGALALLRPGEVEWTAAKLEEAMAPYWAEHATIDLTPRARRPDLTFLQAIEGEAKRWTARQRILDPAGHGDWMVEARVDLGQPHPEDAPLLELVRIGI